MRIEEVSLHKIDYANLLLVLFYHLKRMKATYHTFKKKNIISRNVKYIRHLRELTIELRKLTIEKIRKPPISKFITAYKIS